MAAIQESRPGQSSYIEFGGSFAQPSASPHAVWTGQTVRRLNWSGERNAAQPIYAAFEVNVNQTEVDSRFRQMVGDILDSWGADPQNTAVLKLATEEAKNRVRMQLYTLSGND